MSNALHLQVTVVWWITSNQILIVYLDLAAESNKKIFQDFLLAKMKDVAEIIRMNKRVTRVLSYWLLAAQ